MPSPAQNSIRPSKQLIALRRRRDQVQAAIEALERIEQTQLRRHALIRDCRSHIEHLRKSPTLARQSPRNLKIAAA